MGIVNEDKQQVILIEPKDAIIYEGIRKGKTISEMQEVIQLFENTDSNESLKNIKSIICKLDSLGIFINSGITIKLQN
jgi:hypothetical protein